MCEASFEVGVLQDSRCAICCFADSRLKGVEKGGGALQRISRTGGYSCFRFFWLDGEAFFSFDRGSFVWLVEWMVVESM